MSESGWSESPPSRPAPPPRQPNPLTQGSGRPRTSRTVQGRIPPRSSSEKASKGASGGSKDAPDYEQKIQELLAGAAVPLILASVKAPPPQDKALLADGAALIHYSGPIAHGVNEVAKINPQAAALLAKVFAVTPYAELLAPIVMLGVQLFVNHKQQLLPLAHQVGVKSQEEIIQEAALPLPVMNGQGNVNASDILSS